MLWNWPSNLHFLCEKGKGETVICPECARSRHHLRAVPGREVRDTGDSVGQKIPGTCGGGSVTALPAEGLFSKYGVLPEYYEDLGDGIYQVYVEVGGEIVPFVTVNSATGDYHG